MTPDAGPDAARPLRADALRNAERLLGAAREVFAELGPEATLETVAERAGVGIRTLYRRFPHKEALVRAALEQGVAAHLASVIEQALADPDPRRGLVSVIEATLTLVDRERNLVAAATDSGALTAEVTAPLLDPLAVLTERAQAAGQIRADLTAEDLPRIICMLTNVMGGTDVNGWRRCLALILDGLAPGAATPLPPATSGS